MVSVKMFFDTLKEKTNKQTNQKTPKTLAMAQFVFNFLGNYTITKYTK